MSNEKLKAIESKTTEIRVLVKDMNKLISEQFDEDMEKLKLCSDSGADRMNRIGEIELSCRAINYHLGAIEQAVAQAIKASSMIEVK